MKSRADATTLTSGPAIPKPAQPQEVSMSDFVEPDQPAPSAQSRAAKSKLLGRRPVVGGFLALAAMSGYAYWNGGGTDISGNVDPGEVEIQGSEEDTDESQDERIARMVLGTWETDRSNRHQEITFRKDGTATMQLTINSWMDRLGLGGAENVRLDVEWKITDGLLDSRTVGGEPTFAVKTINRIYGDAVKYKILKLTEDRLLIQDPEPDKEPDHDWKRIKS